MSEGNWILWPWGTAFVRLTQAEAATILARGLSPGPNAAPAPPAEAETALLDAKAMGERLGTTAEWVECAARGGRVPSVLVGRYRRFDPRAVLEALSQQGGG